MRSADFRSACSVLLDRFSDYYLHHFSQTRQMADRETDEERKEREARMFPLRPSDEPTAPVIISFPVFCALWAPNNRIFLGGGGGTKGTGVKSGMVCSRFAHLLIYAC